MKKCKKRMIVISTVLILFTISIGVLFYDDGSLSGFTSNSGEAEYKEIYQEAMAQMPDPQKEFWLETDFGKVKLYYFSSPNADSTTPLLLLPGKSASTPMWEPNLSTLIQECPVYTLDLLGEPGLSVESRRIETASDQSQWLSQVIAALPEEKVNVLGLSFGGWSAANLAIHSPDKISSLILVDPVYVFDSIPLKMILASIPASVPIIPKKIRETMLSYISGGAKADDDVLIARLIESGMGNFKSKQPMPQLIDEKDLSDLDIPVLAVLAGQSTMHHVERAKQCADKNLTHDLSLAVVFEKASHAINGEYPDELAETIFDFIKEIEKE